MTPPLLPSPRRADLSDRRTVAAVDATDIEVQVGAPGLPPEGYRIRINSDGVVVDAADPAGGAHARRTLAQLARLHDGRWPHGEIEDHPDLAVRGVMLDVSRDKVPTTETLYDLVDLLGSWKINHLQLYVEHTFAHPGHDEVWRHASPFTAEEIGDLDAFCRDRHIELVPNQNTLGHMERYLIHPRYRPLSLTPDGFRWLGLVPRPPSTLDPANPDAFDLAAELVGNWTRVLDRAGRFHVGLDEPWELPETRLGEYVEWSRRLRSLPALADREMLMWGDILAAHPELAAQLPAGVTVCEWGYEAGHPWTAQLETLAAAGLDRWVCPGTSSWDSLLGRTTNMVDNIGEAVDAALVDGGVSGFLVTDWGDWGHLQYLPVSLSGFAWAAAQSWCRAANRDLDLAAALDTHAPLDPPLTGAALLALGDAHLSWAPRVPNVAACFLHLWLPQLPVSWGTTQQLEAVDAVLDQPVSQELSTTIDLARILLDDARARLGGDGHLASIPEGVRRQLADRIDAVIDAHRVHWSARNRPGGLEDSCAWMVHLRDAYRSGWADPDWSGPLQMVSPS